MGVSRHPIASQVDKAGMLEIGPSDRTSQGLTYRLIIANDNALLDRLSGNFWFFDASNGFEEIPEWGGDQVDHGREGCGIAIAPGASASRLEETVEALQSGVAVS